MTTNTATDTHPAVLRAAEIVMAYPRDLWAAKLAGLHERWPNLAILTAIHIGDMS